MNSLVLDQLLLASTGVRDYYHLKKDEVEIHDIGIHFGRVV